MKSCILVILTSLASIDTSAQEKYFIPEPSYDGTPFSFKLPESLIGRNDGHEGIVSFTDSRGGNFLISLYKEEELEYLPINDWYVQTSFDSIIEPMQHLLEPPVIDTIYLNAAGTRIDVRQVKLRVYEESSNQQTIFYFAIIPLNNYLLTIAAINAPESYELEYFLDNLDGISVLDDKLNTEPVSFSENSMYETKFSYGSIDFYEIYNDKSNCIWDEEFGSNYPELLLAVMAVDEEQSAYIGGLKVFSGGTSTDFQSASSKLEAVQEVFKVHYITGIQQSGELEGEEFNFNVFNINHQSKLHPSQKLYITTCRGEMLFILTYAYEKADQELENCLIKLVESMTYYEDLDGDD